MKRAWHILSPYLPRVPVFAVMVAMFCAIMLFATPDAAQAQTTGVAAAAGVSCASTPNATGGLVANCSCYAGVANRIIGCVRQTLDNAAQAFFNPNTGFYSLVRQPLYALLTLAIAIYGAMLAAGMVEKPSRDTFVLLLKIGFVVWGVQNSQWIYNYLMAMIDALSSVMFQFNMLDNVPGNSCPNLSSVWMRIDCVLDKVIGINLSEFKPSDYGNAQDATRGVINDGLQNGLVGVFFTLMKGSDVGFMIGLIGLISTWTMLVFLIKVLFAFLAAFIGLVFMVTIGPLFIPLVIFKSTKQYFDKWVKVVISTALQPVLLLSFVTFAVAAMDLVIFSGERSVYRTIAGDAAMQPGFSMNDYMMGTPVDTSSGVNPDDSRTLHPYTGGFLKPNSAGNLQVKGADNLEDFGKIIGSVSSAVTASISDCTDESIGVVTPSETQLQQSQAAASGVPTGAGCSQTFGKRIPFYDIDWDGLAQNRVPPVNLGDTEQSGDPNTEGAEGRALKREVMASVVLAAAMMFLINALMRVVPEICNDLTGEFMYTPNYFNVGGDWNAQTQIADQISNVSSKAAGGGGGR